MPTELTHPDDQGNTIEVDDDRVNLYKASGWVEGKPAPKPKTASK